MPSPTETAAPPREFLIWSFGKIATTKGTFLFDDASAKSVLASFREYGNRLTIDYEHMAVDPNRRAGDGKCAGSFLLELRADGLYAVDVRWTPPAHEALANREWLYFSPYFSAEEKTGRILDLINLALTNIPATRGMTPLVAASRRFSMATADSSKDDSSTETATDDAPPPSDRPPTDEEKKAATQRAAKAKVARLRAELAAAEEECTSLADDGDGDGAGQPSAEEQETLDGEEGDDDPPPAATARLGRTTVAGGIHQIAAAARAATGKKSPDQIVGALTALGRTQGVLTALQRRVAELEAKTRRDEVTALVSTAVKQGKLTPAEREWALSYGMESPEKLRGYLDVTPSRATLAGSELREPRRGAGAVALSEVERKICQNAGLDPEKFALAKQRPIRTSTGGI